MIRLQAKSANHREGWRQEVKSHTCYMIGGVKRTRQEEPLAPPAGTWQFFRLQLLEVLKTGSRDQRYFQTLSSTFQTTQHKQRYLIT